MFRTVDDRYIIDLSAVNPRWRQISDATLIAFHLTTILENHKGDAYSMSKLRDEVAKKVAVQTQTFATVVRELRQMGLVQVTDDEKIWLVGNPPKKPGK